MPHLLQQLPLQTGVELRICFQVTHVLSPGLNPIQGSDLTRTPEFDMAAGAHVQESGGFY